jgi:hypothetical protein
VELIQLTVFSVVVEERGHHYSIRAKQLARQLPGQRRFYQATVALDVVVFLDAVYCGLDFFLLGGLLRGHIILPNGIYMSHTFLTLGDY